MLRIVSVHPEEALTVHVLLTDGSERDIDLTPFMWGPVFRPLLADRTLFTQVFVDPISQTLAWPNGADIDADVLLGLEQPARPSHA